MGIRYKDAGVDLDKNAGIKEGIGRIVRPTFGPEVLGTVGGFGGLFALDGSREKDPVLVSSVDGVGTKLAVAKAMGRHDTVGIDIVSHCANDVGVQGARPLFFLDYFAAGRVQAGVFHAVLAGLAAGCKAVGCALIGGETAEMPGMYQGEDYDLVGCMIGVVSRKDIIDGSRVGAGDVLLGLPSSGLHTNGYSLARKVLLEHKGHALDKTMPGLGCTLGEALLAPHREYVNLLLKMREKIDIKGLVHITGGGFTENIPRVLPKELDAVLQADAWEVPAIFRLIEKEGDVPREEMLRTFNMGIGMIVVVGEEEADAAMDYFGKQGEAAKRIGEVQQGSGKVRWRDG